MRRIDVIESLEGCGAFRRGEGAAAWSPLDLPNLARWYDVDDDATRFQNSALTTPVAADADPLGGLLDKAAGANHATQTVSGRRPIVKFAIQNGRDVARFDGTDDWLEFPLIASITDFSLFVVQQSSGDKALLGEGADITSQWRVGEGGNTIAAFDGSTNPISSTLGTPRTSFSAVGYIRSGSTVAFYQDGTAYGTGTLAVAMSADRIAAFGGGVIPLAGDIGELVFCTSALSGTNRQQLESYLRSRWATA